MKLTYLKYFIEKYPMLQKEFEAIQVQNIDPGLKMKYIYKNKIIYTNWSRPKKGKLISFSDGLTEINHIAIETSLCNGLHFAELHVLERHIVFTFLEDEINIHRLGKMFNEIKN